MRKPKGMFIQGNDIYVCDTGNNRILQITKKGNGYTLTRIIDQLQGCTPATMNTPTDVFADTNGNLYIADSNNYRVVMVDKNLNFVKEFTKPDDATFDKNISFTPYKLVVDVSGRVYVLATNVNKGLVKYESDTVFTGFVGANKVTYNIGEYIWKTFFTTEAQRSQQEAFVPTEYENIYMDEYGFIYATNIVFSEYDLKYDNAKPIRRLNGIGNDILIKNDRYPPIGDLFWVEGTITTGPSKLVDVTVLGNDVYVALDKTRGRLFGYDAQGVMLWAFGNSGNSNGSFVNPSALDHMGNDLYVLDETECSITVFTNTEYGSLIFQANEAYLKGDYDGSADIWREVLKLNANYNLAFIGIGRSLLRQEHFKEAMDYFKMAHDRENYGRAFRLYRKIWVEENILWIVIVVLAFIAVWLVLRTIKKMKMEVAVYELKRIRK